MIRPYKYLDLNTCVLRISAKILEILKVEKYLKFDELEKQLQATIDIDAKYNYLKSLNFLFLLGKLRYEVDTDTIIYSLR